MLLAIAVPLIVLVVVRIPVMRVLRPRWESSLARVRALNLNRDQQRTVRRAVSRGCLPADIALRDKALQYARLVDEQGVVVVQLLATVVAPGTYVAIAIAYLTRDYYPAWTAAALALAASQGLLVAVAAILVKRRQKGARALLREHGHGGVVPAEAADGPATLGA